MKINKFRAYLKTFQVVVAVKIIDFEEKYIVHEPLQAFTGLDCFDESNEVCVTNFTDIEIMQFTGILDMNGKEIFEGDILGYSGKVSYEHAAFWCENAEWLHDVNESEEVIGNIFEHPELLKG